MKELNENYIIEQIAINEDGLLSKFWNWLIGKSDSKYNYWDENDFNKKEFEEVLKKIDTENVKIETNISTEKIKEKINSMKMSSNKSVFSKVSDKINLLTDDQLKEIKWCISIVNYKNELNQICAITGYFSKYKDEENAANICVYDYANMYSKSINYSIVFKNVVNKIMDNTKKDVVIITDDKFNKKIIENIESLFDITELSNKKWKLEKTI